MSQSAELMKILLVEDSLADVELTLEALQDAKVANEVTVVRDGAAAIEHLRAKSDTPDLVILDLNLPCLSGHEVLAAMQADASMRRIPVAVLTMSCSPSTTSGSAWSGCRNDHGVRLHR
jgi:chemotaxis family two-component system response regulator Rcp1